MATVLCDKSTPPISGLDDLYRALRLGRPGQRLVATTVNSLGLSARTVSSLNPRVLVFDDTSHLSEADEYEQVVAAGFTRGEQLVELVGLDPATYEYNFYLLRFQQACNRTRCTPEDLLTEKIGAAGPSGPCTPTTISRHAARLRVVPPALRQGNPQAAADAPGPRPLDALERFSRRRRAHAVPETAGGRSAGKVVVTVDGLDLLRAIEGPTGRYAGVPVAELHAAESGKALRRSSSRTPRG